MSSKVPSPIVAVPVPSHCHPTCPEMPTTANKPKYSFVCPVREPMWKSQQRSLLVPGGDIDGNVDDAAADDEEDAVHDHDNAVYGELDEMAVVPMTTALL